MTSIEFLIVFSMTAFYFSVVSRRKGLDFLVPNSELSQRFLKERQRLFPAVAHLISKFKPIISLNTLNSVGKLFHYMFQKLCGRVCTLLLECFKIAKATVFVDEGLLIVFLPGSFSHKAGSGNIFYINLSPLSRIFHLFIRFWECTWDWAVSQAYHQFGAGACTDRRWIWCIPAGAASPRTPPDLHGDSCGAYP